MHSRPPQAQRSEMQRYGSTRLARSPFVRSFPKKIYRFSYQDYRFYKIPE
jgi:hypothetical protein